MGLCITISKNTPSTSRLSGILLFLLFPFSEGDPNGLRRMQFLIGHNLPKLLSSPSHSNISVVGGRVLFHFLCMCKTCWVTGSASLWWPKASPLPTDHLFQVTSSKGELMLQEAYDFSLQKEIRSAGVGWGLKAGFYLWPAAIAPPETVKQQPSIETWKNELFPSNR